MRFQVRKGLNEGYQPLDDRLFLRVSAADVAARDKKQKKAQIAAIMGSNNKADSSTPAIRGEVCGVGQRCICDVKVGDIVLFRYGYKVELDGEEYYSVSPYDVVAKVTK